jgi:hypothetical protein
MIDGEKTRRKLHVDTKGMSGTKVFSGDWESIEDIYDASLPVIGEAWSLAYPMLRCVQIESEELDGGVGELTAQYSTERQLAESFVEINKSFETKADDRTRGWEWKNAGTCVEDYVPTETPVTIWTVRVRQGSSPDEAIRTAQNKINLYEWNGVPAGYLRFLGAEQDSRYAITGALVSIDTVYKFEETTIPQNWFWREPVQDVDADGNGLVYQNKDAAKTDTYTTDATKIGMRKYVSGTAGTGAFDEMEDSAGAARYASCNFALVLGIPG